MSPHEVGLTCQPSSLLDTEGCTQGGYPSYTVNASSVAQIQLAVNFARNNGIRFVIKNTGHDFLGKSSGAGSLPSLCSLVNPANFHFDPQRH